jgi:uncharacterized repeat protein (TIGR01451 family)
MRYVLDPAGQEVSLFGHLFGRSAHRRHRRPGFHRGTGKVEAISRIDPSYASDTAAGASLVYVSGSTFATPPTVSADGRYAVFTSKAVNLANGPVDTNGGDDVFLHDRQTGTLTLVSHAVGVPGTVASGTSNSPTISADGRWIAYLSYGTNLVSGHVERNNDVDVFLYDRVNDTTTLVSHIPASATSTGNGLCGRPSISADGGYVTYSSKSTDLVTGQTDTANTYDVFVFERATGTNTLVSRIPASATTTGNGAANGAVISGDGNWIAFIGWSTNLVSGLTDTNNNEDIYLYERATGAMTLVSHNVSSPTTTGNGLSRTPALSADGSWIAFVSWASNIITGTDNNFGGSDVFLYERATGTNTLVSHIATSAVQTGSDTAWAPSISDDGRWVAFASFVNNLVTGQSDTNWLADVFLYDRTTGASVLVSHTSASLTATGIGNADLPFISRDGSRVVFHGYVRNLVAGQTDTNSVHDVYVYDRASAAVTLASHIPASSTTTGNNYAWEPMIAGDGSSVFFRSNATNLMPSTVRDKNNDYDVFRFDMSTGAVTLLSQRAPGLPEETPNNTSYLGQTGERTVSDNGRYVAFVSNATDVVAGQVDANSSTDVFLYDRVTKATALVSHVPASAVTTSNAMSYDPAVSADGRWVVFASTSTNQVSGQSGDSPSTEDVFLYDAQTGTVTLVSHNAGTTTTPGYCCSDWPAISADGNTVVYRSTAANLVTGQTDTNNSYDIILWDRATNTNLLVTHADTLPATAANGRSWPFALSRNGQWVAYMSDATNQMPAFTNTNGVQSDVFLWERATDATTLVSRAAGLPTQGANSYPGSTLSISSDGRYLVHDSRSTDLVAGQSGPGGQVFVFDRTTGANTLVSRAAASATQGANSFSDTGAISGDGNWIVFETLATDVGTGITDTNSARDLYVYNRAVGTNLLVSHTSATARTTTANNASRFPAISTDGGTIVFQTAATNLTGYDPNGKTDVIYYDRATRTATIASRANNSTTQTANSDSFAFLAVNANGDAAIYSSLATNLTWLDLNAKQDVFLYSHKPVANLSITKTDGTGIVSAGQPITWTITVSNLGPEAVTGATVTDVFPATISGVLWSCTGASGGTCPASGAGNLNATVSLPVGATVTFTANGLLDPAATGTLSNTAQVAAPTSVVDLDAANNSATDLDTIQ